MERFHVSAVQVALLRTDPNMLLADHQQAAAVEGAAQALWACTVSRSGRLALLRAGGLELLGSLLFVSRQSLLVPVVGVIHQCITEVNIDGSPYVNLYGIKKTLK